MDIDPRTTTRLQKISKKVSHVKNEPYEVEWLITLELP